MQGADTPVVSSVVTPRRSNRVAIRNSRLISQEAIIQLMIADLLPAGHFIPQKLRAKPTSRVDYKHLAMPMIHPTTGKSISSYQRLMKDPATAETWMTAFGKDFGGSCQGDNKTEQTGTNAMFVMTPSDIPNISKDRTIMYAWVVVDLCPQKEDPNRIRITAGGNLINYYPGELTTRTANVMTAKLLWQELLPIGPL